MHRFSASSLRLTLKNVTLSCGHHCGYTLQKLKEIFSLWQMYWELYKTFIFRIFCQKFSQGKLKTQLQKYLMDRKTNCTVSAIVHIHQMKHGLAVTQKNVNGSGFICHV